MAVIPIMIEGRRQPVRRNADSARKSGLAEIGRRGSYGRIIPNCGRKGSSGRINFDATRRGSYGRIGIDNTRRGSIGRKGSAADMSRRGSIGRKLEDTVRRGSIGRKSSETKLQTDSILSRRGSGAGTRHLIKKGSRQNLKTFQIKICIEGDDQKDEEPDNRDQNNKQDENHENHVEKGKKDEEEKENISTVIKHKTTPSPWQNVDRGVARVRGGDKARLQTLSRNQSLSNILKESNTEKKNIKNASNKVISDSVNTGGFSNFAKDAVNSHNKYRAYHSAKPLTLDHGLCRHAQNYAEKLANSCTFQHSGDSKYGENLYWAWSSDPNFALKGCEAVDSWYDESLSAYDYSREPTDTESGHFTQVVWSSSERLGVGLARSSAGRHIVVMKYDPPGNYVGQYTKHVHKPTSIPTTKNVHKQTTTTTATNKQTIK